MENIKLTKETINKAKNGISFFLLTLWMIIPILQSFRPLIKYRRMIILQVNLLSIIGIIGAILGVIYIFFKIEKSDNKKQILKEMIPIFILVLYMIWTLISCFFADSKQLAFEGTYYRKEGYYTYIYYAGFFLLAYMLDSKKLRKILLNIFFAMSTFIVTISMISKGYRFTNIFANTNMDNTVFQQFNHYGYFLTMALINAFGLFVTEKKKILKVIYLISFALMTYALMYNNTFGCYLAVIATIILYFIYSIIKKKNRLMTIIAIIVFGIISCMVTKNGIHLLSRNIQKLSSDLTAIINKFTTSDVIIDNENATEEEIAKQEQAILDREWLFKHAGSSRMDLWRYGLKFVQESPIIGYGPENLGKQYGSVKIDQDRPHNLLIQLATTSGIPGMLLYVSAVGIIIITAVVKLIKKNHTGEIFLIIVIAYLISAMFGNSMYYTSPYFFIFLGSLMKCNSFKESEE